MSSKNLLDMALDFANKVRLDMMTENNSRSDKSLPLRLQLALDFIPQYLAENENDRDIMSPKELWEMALAFANEAYVDIVNEEKEKME